MRTVRSTFILVLMAAMVAMLGADVADAGKLGKLKKKKKPKYVLTLADIEPKLAALELGDWEFTGIKYDHIGVSEYDEFFKSAAKLHGLVLLNQEMAGAATKSLKKYAMSRAADEAMKENIDGLVGDTPPEEWTTEQNVAVMKMAKAQKKISADETKYFAKTAGTMAIGVAALSKGLETAQDLAAQGAELQGNTSKVKKLKIPAAVKGTKRSLEHVKAAGEEGPALAEEINVLISAFRALSAAE